MILYDKFITFTDDSGRTMAILINRIVRIEEVLNASRVGR